MKQNKSVFSLESDYAPMGDQPTAISELVAGVLAGRKSQVLLGVTGSGKTFTMANVIQQLSRPTLIMAPNKILAAQLYTEMKSFFPRNHVEYFVSFYDYYQPEAYVPTTDTYIDKDAAINEQLDRMRHSATRAMLEEKDVIVVSSVSSIYGIGAPEQYAQMKLVLNIGDKISEKDVMRALVDIQYKRNEMGFARGDFRARGDTLDIFPAHSQDRAWKVSFFGDEIDEIWEFDTLTGGKLQKLDRIAIYPNTHYATPMPSVLQAIHQIRKDLDERLNYFHDNISDSAITAEIKLKTSGKIAHDIFENIHGTFDASLDGGFIYGLGLSDFYAFAPKITTLNAEYVLSSALENGITPIKNMRIVGAYDNGNIETTKPVLLSLKHTDITGEVKIENNKMMADLKLILRGTSSGPAPIDLIIYPDNKREYSLSEIMTSFDPEYMRTFIQSHNKF